MRLMKETQCLKQGIVNSWKGGIGKGSTSISGVPWNQYSRFTNMGRSEKKLNYALCGVRKITKIKQTATN